MLCVKKTFIFCLLLVFYIRWLWSGYRLLWNNTWPSSGDSESIQNGDTIGSIDYCSAGEWKKIEAEFFSTLALKENGHYTLGVLIVVIIGRR